MLGAASLLYYSADTIAYFAISYYNYSSKVMLQFVGKKQPSQHGIYSNDSIIRPGRFRNSYIP